MSQRSEHGDRPTHRALAAAPRRLLEEGATPLEVALLRSARDDDPPPGAMERAMVAVGLTGAVGAGAVEAAPRVVAKPTGGLTKWLFELLTWAFIGAAGGALFMGGPAVDGSPGAPHRAAEAAALIEAPGSSADERRPGDEPAQGSAAEPQAAAPSQGETSGAHRAPKASSPASPSAPRARKTEARPTLAEEVALLDGARKALTTGNADGALDALRGHEKKFAGGALSAEAAVLRIEALAARGDHEGAAAKARAFLSTYPNDPHAAHVQNLLSQSEQQARPRGAP